MFPFFVLFGIITVLVDCFLFSEMFGSRLSRSWFQNTMVKLWTDCDSKPVVFPLCLGDHMTQNHKLELCS